ncbi:MAG: hypothetical protein NTX15_06220, partial [Candidatus Kapabacteria bacterium]|nr:hypothetical protein [Candidatus Kapabacteria bacterium]
MSKVLPLELATLYDLRRDEILERLADFASVSQDQWFYELCFCLLTPQSSALHANTVIEKLKHLNFQRDGQDVLHILRS